MLPPYDEDRYSEEMTRGVWERKGDINYEESTWSIVKTDKTQVSEPTYVGIDNFL